MYINVHTHIQPQEKEKSLLSVYQNFETVKYPGYYSIGIHPWHITASYKNDMETLFNFAGYSSVIAIGETGLDKVCNTDWSLQKEVFTAQVSLAIRLKKPLIIHCVKAWDEVLAMLEKEKITVPVIFHGFQKNKVLAKQLTDKGYYLSFGKALEKEPIQEVLKSIPVNRFFLETDNAAVSIESVYKYAASVLSIDMNSLSLQLQKNAAAVFGPSFIL